MIDKQLLVNTYGEKYDYITENMNSVKTEINNNDMYEFNDMLYEYLDSLGDIKLLQIKNKQALEEFIEYAKKHKEEFPKE